jgi:hypothetical protein
MANLITLEEYKDFKGLQSVKDDTRLSTLITSVSQLVKTYCGNSIVDYYSSNKTETFNIDWDTHIVQLTESPVNSVSLVEKRSSTTASYETVSTDDYYVDTATDSVLHVTANTYRVWPRGAGAVRVTYTAGYSDTPDDLKLAVIDLITYYFKEEHTQRRTLSGATVENQGTGDGRGFPDHIKRVLDLYKNM